MDVVLIHAFPLNSKMWEGQVSALSQAGYRVLALDMPGFGKRPRVERDLGAYADDCLAQCQEAGVEKAVFVGLSMGGYCLFRIFERAPSRVLGLCLCDTKAEADSDEQKNSRLRLVERIEKEGTAFLPDHLLPLLLGETTRQERPEIVAKVQEMMASASPSGVIDALLAMRGRPDSRPLLGKIGCPVLVAVGEEDTLTPVEGAKAMARAIKGASLEVIPKAGHLSPLENRDAFNKALLRFLESIK